MGKITKTVQETNKGLKEQLEGANRRIAELERKLRDADVNAQRSEQQHNDTKEKLQLSKDAAHSLQAQVIILKDMMRDMFDSAITQRRMGR